MHVLYDYQAQQSDEMTVKIGDVLQIVDDSDPEWYRAKFVTKLGEPGLVPKSYCEIDDSLVKPGKSKKSEEDKQKEEEKKRKQKEERDKKKEEEMARKKEDDAKRKEDEAKRKEEEARKREEERIEREKRKEEDRKKKEEEARIAAEKLAQEKAKFRSEYGNQLNDDVTTARVTFYEKRRDKQYWFNVEVYAPSGNRVIYRTYQDFFDFHARLLECFPDEAGEGGQTRIIPYLPGQKIFVNDSVCKQRRVELDEYTQELYKLPPRITRSRMVVEFFKLYGSDESYAQSLVTRGVANSPFEPTLNPHGPPPPPSNSSNASAAVDNIPPPPARKPPPPGQGGAVRPPPANSGAAQPRPSGPPRPQGGPPRPRSITSEAGLPQRPAPAPAPGGNRPPLAGGARPPPGNQFQSRPPPAQQQAAPPASNQTRSAAQAQAQNGGDMVKVKVHSKDEIVAFLVPKTVRFNDVKQKAFKKFGISPKPLQYRDEDGDLVTINGDDDLQIAFETYPEKLVLYVP